jgi:hypothetical protein
MVMEDEVTQDRANYPSLVLTTFRLRAVLPESYLVEDEVYSKSLNVIAYDI